jgi:hypothetical protein
MLQIISGVVNILMLLGLSYLATYDLARAVIISLVLFTLERIASAVDVLVAIRIIENEAQLKELTNEEK